MNDFPVSYREVIPNQTLPEKWKEFTLNTGGTQSTLQDIKGTQRAGGFYYFDQSKPYIGKRFIYWRMYDDVLELVEHSLDVNLVGNHVRYRFQDSPVLEGLTIHETSLMVIVLVSTVSSVHRLTFPHPERINKQEFAVTQHSEATVKSIFADASAAAFRDPLSFHVINSSASNTLMPHTSASWLCNNNDILYALAYSSGAILLARHDGLNGTMTTTELNNKLTSRFLSGLTGALRGRPSEENVPASMIIHSMEADTYLFSLSRSGSLKAWSCSKHQCVMAADILDDAADSGKNMTLGAQSHLLRKASGNFKETELLLGVFLCFATSSECQFVVLQITCSNGVFRYVRLFSINAPRGQDLVDFSLCRSELWAVWRDNQGETVVSTVKINVDAYSNPQWESAILEPGPDRDFVLTDPMADPRQAYISYIFYPGRFSLSVIMRALSIFRRVSGFPLYENFVSAEILKSDVCQAVEQEINNEASSFDLTDEEYLEVANRCWAKLYSCCVQYHVSSSRPIGLLLLPGGNQFGVALVNKAYVSLLRRTDVVETLFACSPDTLSCSPFPGISADVSADILILVKLLNDLDEQLSEEAKINFERDLQRLISPDDIAEELVHDMLTRYSYDEEIDAHYLRILQKELSRLKDAAVAMNVILEALDQPYLKEPTFTGQDTSRHLLAVRFLFASHMGISMLAETTRQIVSMRFNLCRNLLILQQIILQSDVEQASPDTVAQIRTALVPRTVIWTQSYYVLQWICQTPVSPAVKLNVLETNIQRMAILRLTDSTAGAFSIAAASVNGARSGPLPAQTLFELFLSMTGARHAHLLLSQHLDQRDVKPCWSSSILIFSSILTQMIWPINHTFIFPEFLMSSCQYLLVQEYARLLNKWCQANICSRKFLLGLAFLDMREPHKALDFLVEAANGISSEDFLRKKIVPSTEDCTMERLQIIYFLKVSQLFEQQNYPDYVIQLADIAINLADKHDPDLPTLYSVAFVNHLRLDHPQEAFHALNANPDGARKKDCLKELVLTLLERKRLDLLLDFPYDNLSHDLERIVESRARSLDINNPIFYNFLYAFHVRKGNMRKAASTMYEQAMRLGLEGTHGAATTERQVKCYLACLNSLELVDPRFAWIVKPVMNSLDEDTADTSMMSPKRNSCGDEVPSSQWRRQVEVLEVADIRLEYEIVQCRLRLERHSAQKYARTGCMLSPVELVAVLAQTGMYQAAVQLALRHRLSCQPILESMASACVRLTVASESLNREAADAWEWLNENDLSDLGVGNGNAVTVAWRLLADTLQKCEKDRDTVLHKSVVTRLLGLGVFLPNWLVMSYKERNPAEFLRLLLGAGRLEEAADLGIEIIWAALGRGKERLGFSNALHIKTPPLCLPHNTLHMLQLELEAAAREDSYYEALLNEFKPLYNDYLQKAKSISRDHEIACLTEDLDEKKKKDSSVSVDFETAAIRKLLALK